LKPPPGAASWQDTRKHAVHCLRADWWDSCYSKPEGKGEKEPQLPRYTGWPTAGPSEDAALLKMRAARCNSHVDWTNWAKETKDPLPHFAAWDDRRKAAVESCPLSTWCTNYGYIGTDGQVHWPEEMAIGSSRRFISVAWRTEKPEAATPATAASRSESAAKEGSRRQAARRSKSCSAEMEEPPQPKTSRQMVCRISLTAAPEAAPAVEAAPAPEAAAAEEAPASAPDATPSRSPTEALMAAGMGTRASDALLEAERSWALLRAAYLAGAQSDIGEATMRPAAEEPAKMEPISDRSLDEAALVVRERLERLLKKTSEAVAALSGQEVFCTAPGIVAASPVATKACSITSTRELAGS